MAAPTIGRLKDEILRLFYGGNVPIAGKVTPEEVGVAIGQVCNNLLKTDILTVNNALREKIPNGTVLGLYENIPVTSWRGKSICTLPIKPLKLERGMGVFSIFEAANPDNEFIPLQMGQFSMVRSQPSIINNVLGQCAYEVYGMQIVFTKDLSTPDPNNPFLVSMRLAIMDITSYGDFDPLPILPEMEWQIKKEVIALFAGEQVADKIIDAGRKEQKGVPLPQQSQT